MKNIYIISILNSAGVMVSFTIIAPTMASAVAKAQDAAGVTHDPATFQKSGTVDYEV